MKEITIDELFKAAGFKPNKAQCKAIKHIDGPLFLVAGPGSGKTRVLLWRTVNLIVCHEIKPEEIYLGTFTEKAAHQLKEGLRTLLGRASNLTGKSYDISKMYVGTVHSSCQRLIADRNFSKDRSRRKPPLVLDQIDQYFLLQDTKFWEEAKEALDLPDEFFNLINQRLSNDGRYRNSQSKYVAVQNCISLFNRFSEEVINPDEVIEKSDDDILVTLAELYKLYLEMLGGKNRTRVDFSLLQQEALNAISETGQSGSVFKYIIVDEYQDTNTIQERIFFKLASGTNNICVVGDDDQALYRFRGATVENFVQFPERCKKYLKLEPETIWLNTNYRSRKNIVTFYTRFIDKENWKSTVKGKNYRLVNKGITAHSDDGAPSVIASTKASSEDVAAEIADLVKSLLDKKKVSDPNQIAFLYPSLKGAHPKRMIDALEERGLLVYAPRANKFLECDEPTKIFGLFIKVMGRPEKGPYSGGDYNDFHNWLDRCESEANTLIRGDRQLKAYIKHKQDELERINHDFELLSSEIQNMGLTLKSNYEPDKHKRKLSEVAGISSQAKKSITGSAFDRIARLRLQEGNPFQLNYVVNRATSPDWSVLDLFYRFCGFDHFKAMFDLAEAGTDEGPVCNLALVSEYLGRFIEKRGSVITGSFLADNKFQNVFFTNYLYTLFRMGEGEFEDVEDPFPKGRIPFLTIHQSKGLEFPVVVLGNPRKGSGEPQPVEAMVRPFISGKGEPLQRTADFDDMRMFYVALSRAENLLVMAHLSGQGVKVHPHLKEMLEDPSIDRIPDFKMKSLPAATKKQEEIPKTYSFTADYMQFQRCPRQYMVFRKFGFVPSRSQTMFFGSLVHQTIEDLHNRLISLNGGMQ